VNPIRIKPSRRGLLHKELGVPQGQRIPTEKLAMAKRSSDPAERKRATFAMNARSWAKPKKKRQTLRSYLNSDEF
jgi:hypothetical protein